MYQWYVCFTKITFSVHFTTNFLKLFFSSCPIACNSFASESLKTFNVFHTNS